MTYAKDNAEFIYAGKRGGHHEMTQDEINAVLVQKARKVKQYADLKVVTPLFLVEVVRRLRFFMKRALSLR